MAIATLQATENQEEKVLQVLLNTENYLPE